MVLRANVTSESARNLDFYHSERSQEVLFFLLHFPLFQWFLLTQVSG